MKHYVITMFNLHITWGGVDRTTSEKFLEYRFRLFETYTFPSLKGQINQRFKWLVLFSASTPEKYRNRIRDYQNNMTNFIPIYIEDEKATAFKDYLTAYIGSETEKGEVSVTTRCDSDDVLNRHFIDEIQKNIRTGCPYIISFPNGFQYDEKTNMLRSYYFPTNHFTTYVTDQNEKTVYDFLHMDVLKQCDVRLLEHPRMWVEVIHNGNVYNCMGSLRYKDYIRKYDLSEEFGLPVLIQHHAAYLFILYIYFAVHKLWVKRKRIKVFIKRKREDFRQKKVE